MEGFYESGNFVLLAASSLPEVVVGVELGQTLAFAAGIGDGTCFKFSEVEPWVLGVGTACFKVNGARNSYRLANALALEGIALLSSAGLVATLREYCDANVTGLSF